MEKHRLFELPCASTGAIKEPTLIDRDDGGLLVSLVGDDDGRSVQAGVLFVKPRAFRKRAEVYCTSWHVKDVYDTVCEIRESDWVAELRVDAVAEWRDRWVMRHFMIYLDSFGCLEVIAESASLEGNP
jgi:hypothetical protein